MNPRPPDPQVNALGERCWAGTGTAQKGRVSAGFTMDSAVLRILPVWGWYCQHCYQIVDGGGSGNISAYCNQIRIAERPSMTRDFFAEQADHSEVKSAIVATYFRHWAKVITGYLKRQRKPTTIQYIDLFAGPGRYKDGSKSTPLLILEAAIKDPLLRDNLVTSFNDVEPASTSSLVAEIKKLPGIERLKYAPDVSTEEVGENIVKMFESVRLIPTLFFVDPWGYKGLSLRLINSVLKDWACECIFFFNYGRINAGLSNELVKTHMHALFGPERGEALRVRLEPMSPEERELTIVEEICEALIELGGKYTLPFVFK
ncbi:MAG TPA: three-Cys-motif partner protein TcmP, partial [Pirellulales bacterium]|nr:three-Cys-motif partner protein TcmP [Pirellulales bacterium]